MVRDVRRMKHELALSACSEHHGGTLHSAQEIRGKALALGAWGLQLALQRAMDREGQRHVRLPCLK